MALATLLDLCACLPPSELPTWRDVERQAQWLRFVQDQVPPFDVAAHSGRGIVMAAGGVVLLTNAWVSVKAIRRHGCTLPIEIWHSTAAEISPAFADAFRGLGCEVKDVAECVRGAGQCQRRAVVRR